MSKKNCYEQILAAEKTPGFIRWLNVNLARDIKKSKSIFKLKQKIKKILDLKN
jgi:hypothetical protein